MTYLQKCKLIAYLIFTSITALEVLMLCLLVNADLEHTPYTLFSIVTFVAVFNTSIWWFRKIYGRAKRYHTEREINEQNT